MLTYSEMEPWRQNRVKFEWKHDNRENEFGCKMSLRNVSQTQNVAKFGLPKTHFGIVKSFWNCTVLLSCSLQKWRRFDNWNGYFTKKTLQDLYTRWASMRGGVPYWNNSQSLWSRHGTEYQYKSDQGRISVSFMDFVDWVRLWSWHYSDVIMGGAISSRITIVYSTVYSGANQRKHRGSESLAFVRGIHRWLVNSPHKGPVTRKMFPFDDVIMEIDVSQALNVMTYFPHLQLPRCMWHRELIGHLKTADKSGKRSWILIMISNILQTIYSDPCYWMIIMIFCFKFYWSICHNCFR